MGKAWKISEPEETSSIKENSMPRNQVWMVENSQKLEWNLEQVSDSAIWNLETFFGSSLRVSYWELTEAKASFAASTLVSLLSLEPLPWLVFDNIPLVSFGWCVRTKRVSSSPHFTTLVLSFPLVFQSFLHSLLPTRGPLFPISRVGKMPTWHFQMGVCACVYAIQNPRSYHGLCCFPLSSFLCLF